jgi:hypothetical protein
MKRIYFLISLLVAGTASFAQTVPGGDMDTWRNSTAGSSAAVAIHAPFQWYGFDSLIIANGQLFFAGNSWYAQLFQENTIKNGGASAAKIISKKQDTSILGVLPGSLSNAKASVNVLALLSGGSIGSATTFTGGTAVGMRVMTVSAYVQYWPGIDTTTHMWGGADTGLLTVQAYSTVHGVDTLVGVGFVDIAPCSTFVQVTANVIYADTIDTVNTVRIIFSSSGASYSLDSSTLFVDDVTMTGVPQYHHPVAIQNVSANIPEVKVYPNPATGTLYFEGQQAGLSCELISVNGRSVLHHQLAGKSAIDVSNLPSGLYFYNVADAGGNIVQRGKVIITR